MRELTLVELSIVSGGKSANSGDSSISAKGGAKGFLIDYALGKALDYTITYGPDVANFINSVPMPVSFEKEGSEYTLSEWNDNRSNKNQMSNSKLIQNYMKEMKKTHTTGSD